MFLKFWLKSKSCSTVPCSEKLLPSWVSDDWFNQFIIHVLTMNVFLVIYVKWTEFHSSQLYWGKNISSIKSMSTVIVHLLSLLGFVIHHYHDDKQFLQKKRLITLPTHIFIVGVFTLFSTGFFSIFPTTLN